ncbi:MAG: hypothetical protein EP344_14925 [Bacteroidetes bacterium]|nr:MAG: hypothetical protein EP344_14925 [Bacteroidota bacterium]
MKNVLPFFVFLIITNILPAQNQPPSTQIGQATELSSAISGGRSKFVQTFDNRFNDAVKGSPFLCDEWIPGTLTLFDSTTTGDSLLFKFDAYHNEVWVRKIKGDSVIPYSDYIRAIDLRHPDGRAWHFKKYHVDNGSNPVRFFQPVYEGTTYTLIKDEYKPLVKANFVERGVYTTGLPYDRFEGTTVDYYLQKGKGESFEKVSLKKKSLLEAVPAGKKNAADSYCKKNKIGKGLSETEATALLQVIEQ